MGKEKSKVVTTIDVLFDNVQHKEICCIKIITHPHIPPPPHTIRFVLSLFQNVCICTACDCGSVSWAHVACSQSNTLKNIHGLKSTQTRQTTTKTTTTWQPGQSCTVLLWTVMGPLWCRFGPAEGKHVGLWSKLHIKCIQRQAAKVHVCEPGRSKNNVMVRHCYISICICSTTLRESFWFFTTNTLANWKL